MSLEKMDIISRESKIVDHFHLSNIRMRKIKKLNMDKIQSLDDVKRDD